MSKRAGKYGLRKDYKGFTRGVGGLKCRCCGGDPYSLVRKYKNKLEKAATDTDRCDVCKKDIPSNEGMTHKDCGGKMHRICNSCFDKLVKEAREAGGGCSCKTGGECSCGAGEEQRDDIPRRGKGESSS